MIAVLFQPQCANGILDIISLTTTWNQNSSGTILYENVLGFQYVMYTQLKQSNPSFGPAS